VIAERRVEILGSGAGGGPSTFTRILEVDGPRPDHPVLCFHGNPSPADDWIPFLERLEGRRHVIAPDLLGWGESDRPRSFHWTMDALAAWIGDLIDTLGLRRFDLAMHDWGSVALLAAVRRPEAVERVVIMNTVPMTPDYEWHWIARLWRRRGVGELLNATNSRFGTRQLLRQAVTNKSARAGLAAQIHEHFDRGTKRAVLELYRDADPEKFAPIRESLRNLTGPALVVWGDADPYLGPQFADAIAGALGGEATVEHVAGAGHWPWLDRPEVIEIVCDFLGSETAAPPTNPAAP
jgi:pimeloyl-ACP methyl ester carboxylesterase